MRLLLTLLLALGVAVPAARAQALDQLLNSFDQRREQADQGRDTQLAKLRESYNTALRRLLDRTKASGNLDAVRPVNDEITAIVDRADSLPPLPETAPAELRKLRATYEDGRHKILKTHGTVVTDLAGKLDAALQKLETDLTRAGKIDDAIAARNAREELAKDPALADARDLATLGAASGKGKPALQLRRHGDHLEVIVFYDRAGKISMASPVENTRERTGEGKELGSSKARTLGEFVGAKGYQVDPFIAYHQVFDGTEVKGLVLTEIVPEFRFEVEKARGMKLSLKDKPVNAHGNFGPVLPTNAASGSFRISCRYYVPKANRALTGFSFVHAVGGPIGGTRFTESGKWTSGEVTAESSNAAPTLLFYLAVAEGRKAADAAGEFIVLGEMKVEHTKFSAFIQKRIGTDGKPLAEQNDPAQQPLFIANGEFAQR